MQTSAQSLTSASSPAPDPAGLADVVSDPDRLASLDATRLLDSRVEEAFDRLTRIASRLLGVPVALVSFVDDDRQWFKSALGLPEPWASRRETPLSHSFCQYVVRDQEELVVSDARQHPIFAENGATLDIGVVAYAGVPLTGNDGQPLGSFCAIDSEPRAWSEDDLALLRDLAASAMSEIELRRALAHQSFQDALTGLPNRSLLLDRVTRALREATADGTVAVACVDLHGFSSINRADGRDAGDRLLVEAARRLEGAVGGSESVARLGADCFAVLSRVRDAEEAASLGRLLLSALDRPFASGGEMRHVSACVGVATAVEDLDRAPALLEAAEDALSRAKAAGRGSVELYGSALRAQAASRLTMETELRRAIDRGQMQVVYQPIVDLDQGGVTSVEALLRWQHPELGAVSPAEFIPVAEECGLIETIGEWVLREACHTIAAHNHRHPGQAVGVSVNLSPRQVAARNVVDVVRYALVASGLGGQSLMLEITEGVLLEQASARSGTLAALSDLGAKIALDDFGTGYSSLAYIRQFPIDVIKVDRCFVATLGEDTEDDAIVAAIVDMGRRLGTRVVAEGVETREQATALRELGCPGAQGWLFGKPSGRDALGSVIASATRTAGLGLQVAS